MNNKKENRLSRRLTVNALEPYISIRPIIKKSDNEAAYTLIEAYADNNMLRWLTGSIKDDKKRQNVYHDIFKGLIRSAASESREFAVQLNGCKGVMLWSESQSEILSVGNAIGSRRLWGSLGAVATVRALLIHHRHLAKMKRRIMDGRSHLTIHFIGVLPNETKCQAGSALMQYLINRANEAQLPIFVEVWGKHHLGWFEKFGFVVEAKKSFSDKEDAIVYYIVREPEMDAETPRNAVPTEAGVTLHLEPPREDLIIGSA
ncbi:hypothetical protein K501DRAFT_244364 [Backusella circina FSU 941]|nr:hypothetical protein K501DRAFT_244364 [Backusella circina FSU 941]